MIFFSGGVRSREAALATTGTAADAGLPAVGAEAAHAESAMLAANALIALYFTCKARPFLEAHTNRFASERADHHGSEIGSCSMANLRQVG